MSFIDKSEKNVGRQLLKEVSGGAVGGFVGSRGKRIDDLRAGPFHPDFGDLMKTIKKNMQYRKEARKDLNLSNHMYGGESPIGGYFDLDTEVAENTYTILDDIDAFNKEFNDEVTPDAEIEWKSTGWDYDYDEPGEAYKERVLKYDDNRYLYADDTYINKSTTNWKIIDRG